MLASLARPGGLRYEPGMAIDAIPGPRKLVVPIAAVHREVVKSFLLGLCGSMDEPAEGEWEGQRIMLPVFDTQGRGDTALASGLSIADGLILLIRHLDAESIERARETLAAAPPPDRLPRVLVIGRAEMEREYKAACPACAQKMLLNDADAGRGARCPRCEYRFRILEPAAYLRAALNVGAATPVYLAALGQPAGCRACLGPLLRAARPAPPAVSPVAAAPALVPVGF